MYFTVHSVKIKLFSKKKITALNIHYKIKLKKKLHL